MPTIAPNLVMPVKPITVQLDTRPSATDISSPVSVPNGRGSGPTATSTTGGAMQAVPMSGQVSGQSPARRVRHDVADAVRVAAFSLAASAVVALGLSAFSHWVGAA